MKYMPQEIDAWNFSYIFESALKHKADPEIIRRLEELCDSR